MSQEDIFDIAFVGHFTKDTVVTPQGSTVHLGGAFYYGCHVVVHLGLKAAVVTRLAREDWAVVDELRSMGVTVLATATPVSTNLRLVYPAVDSERRIIYNTSFAGAFTPEEVAPVQARAFHVGASIRGEVPVKVLETIAAKGALLSLDVQGFLRVNKAGELVYAPWPAMARALSLVNILKVDATEAEYLTGHRDQRQAAQALAAYGPQEVVLTSNDGVLVLAEGVYYQAPWQARVVKGRTGRGDTCIAAYLARRLTAGPEEATLFAAAVTGRKLEASGPFKGFT